MPTLVLHAVLPWGRLEFFKTTWEQFTFGRKQREPSVKANCTNMSTRSLKHPGPSRLFVCFEVPCHVLTRSQGKKLKLKWYLLYRCNILMTRQVKNNCNIIECKHVTVTVSARNVASSVFWVSGVKEMRKGRPRFIITLLISYSSC